MPKEQFGARLKEERVRRELTVREMATLTHVNQQAQLSYELGVASPGAKYWAALIGLGMDVLYILSGKRMRIVRNRAESELLCLFRDANLVAKSNAVQALIEGDTPQSPRVMEINVSVDSSAVACRDLRAGRDILSPDVTASRNITARRNIGTRVRRVSRSRKCATEE